jgi:hypothetical protein
MFVFVSLSAGILLPGTCPLGKEEIKECSLYVVALTKRFFIISITG